MYSAELTEAWKKQAHQIGEILVGMRKGISWEIAFDRTKPHILSKPAGYFTGTAGMVETLLQIYCLENGIDLMKQGLNKIFPGVTINQKKLEKKDEDH